MRVVRYEVTHQNKNKPGEGVLLEVSNEPPKNLECPNFEGYEDVFIIETEDNDPNEWKGCRVSWMGKYWTIELSLSIANGEKALLTLVES